MRKTKHGFHDVCSKPVIVQAFYDEYVALPTTEDGWKAELNALLEDWRFPFVGPWDGFHVYISSNLKNFLNFKKRYCVTNMGLRSTQKNKTNAK